MVWQIRIVKQECQFHVDTATAWGCSKAGRGCFFARRINAVSRNCMGSLEERKPKAVAKHRVDQIENSVGVHGQPLDIRLRVPSGAWAFISVSLCLSLGLNSVNRSYSEQFYKLSN